MLEVITGDKRNFQRVLFDTPVRVTDGENTFESSLIDISLNGALIKKPSVWKQNKTNQYQLIVPLMNEGEYIKMEVHAAHEGNQTIGFQCDRIDLDSISYLRRLVELNVGDIKLIERELSALIH